MTVRRNRYDCSDSHPACHTLREDSRRLGVSDPGNLPFMFCPPKAETAVLLVHGFTATPWEMLPLADFLADTGIASLGIRLPGHGTTPEDLAGRRWEEWAQSLNDGFEILSSDFQTIYGMGMSTGCLLLLEASRRCEFAGMVLFSPYLRVLHRLAAYAGWLRWILPYHVKYTEEEHQSRYYNRRPVAGVNQINRLIKSVRQQLSNVTCPVMAFNGEGDETVDINSSNELMANLGSKVKVHEIFGPDVPHVLTREDNPCRWSMFAQASHFIQEIESPGEPTLVR